MKLKPILIGLMLICFLIVPVLAAGEGTVKVIDKDGNVLTNQSHSNNDDSSDNSQIIKSSDSASSSSSDDNSKVNGLDIWGINTDNSMNTSDYANVNLITSIYSGIVPLRNLSLVAIAISFGLALTSEFVAIFLLVVISAYGAAHPNSNKGMKLISDARTKLIGVGGIFFIGLFMIILTFFFLIIFSKLSLFGM